MYAEVNFLPWREQRRIAGQRGFIARGAGVMVVTLLIIAGLDVYYQRQTEFLKQRLVPLQQQYRQLRDEQSERQLWLERSEALSARYQFLQHRMQLRHHSAWIMQRLPALVPQGVYLDSLSRNGLEIQMRGISTDGAALESLLTNLSRSRDIRAISIRAISAREPRFGEQYQPFELSWQWSFSASEDRR